jgi:hypothetical protein
MKKFCHISLSVLLSMMLLFIGSGVNFMRCAHTGTVTLMSPFGSDAMDGMSCDMNADCMTMEHIELSPTSMAQTITYDFQVLQPLIAALPNLVAEWLEPVVHEKADFFFPQVWKGPPRDYLNLLRVLLI